jgi:hypothetical protein
MIKEISACTAGAFTGGLLTGLVIGVGACIVLSFLAYRFSAAMGAQGSMQRERAWRFGLRVLPDLRQHLPQKEHYDFDCMLGVMQTSLNADRQTKKH